MKLQYFCGIGAELKRQRINFDYMNQLYLYVLSGTETLEQVIAPNFFNEVTVSLQPNDVIFVYSADNSIYTPYKVVKDLDNNVSLTEVKPNFADELEQEMEDIVTSLADYLKKDGSIPLDTGYTPTDDQDIATKKYVDDNAGVGNLLSDGSIPMDLAYTPVNDQDIATKKYVDDEISGQGLGDLAFLDTVGSGQIDTGAVGSDELSSTAITGQTSATIASDDTLVFVDTTDGALKKDTVQGIVDVTTGQLFGGSTVTPDGTELLAVSDGTKVTAQSIADLAGGGGISITPQTLQGTTEAFTGGYASAGHVNFCNLSDKKSLLVYQSASNKFKARIVNTETDGTITLGTANEFTTASGSIGFNITSKVIKLNSTQAILVYANAVSNTQRRAILITYDISTNTITSFGTPVNLNATENTSLNGADILRIDDTKAVVVYSGGTNANEYVYGRVLTVSGSTLTANAEANIITNASYQLNNFINLVYSSNQDRYFVYTKNSNTTVGVVGTDFTISGTTITPSSLFVKSGSTSDGNNLYVTSKGNDFIALSKGTVKNILNTKNVTTHQCRDILSTAISGLFELITGSTYVNYTYKKPNLSETDNYILTQTTGGGDILAFSKVRELNSVKLAIPSKYSGSYTLSPVGIMKVSSTQFVQIFIEATTLYLYFLPFTVQE